ncbi:metal ABC transporter solute-binding protein, Zn/Mn family [Hutsoniella sourekii]
MKKFVKYLLALVICLVLVPGRVTYAQDKKQVMTTFYPVYYLAKRISGDKMDVQMLLNQGQDAHGYESTAKDAAKVQEADLFIYQDDEMEFFVHDLLSLIDQSQTQVLESTEGIELLKGQGHDHDHDHAEEADHDHSHEEAGHDEHDHEHEGHDHEHGEAGHTHEYDPHTWLDPKVYADQAENVKRALIALDPDHEDYYQANADKLSQDLDQLYQEMADQLSQRKNRTFVVQHAAFGYLAHAFDLEQVAISGLSTEQEPSSQQLAQMQDFIKEQQVQAIYVDPSLNSNIAETVAGATNAKLYPLRTLEVVTSEEEAEGVDYFTIMRDNLEELMKE